MPQIVRIVFRGKGGGRYLDTTRWLRDDTRQCYARKIADETLSLTWQITWTATLRRVGSSYLLGSPRSPAVRVNGLVTGKQERDSCDSVEEEPGWNGSSRCDSRLPIVASASLASRRATDGVILSLRTVTFGSPDRPCELDIRNDQLVAHPLLADRSLERAARGSPVTVPVGTNHPGPGDAYLRQRDCANFPHIYDGVVYLYDCEDVLDWDGTLTVFRA
jgi:hypothetical protein